MYLHFANYSLIVAAFLAGASAALAQQTVPPAPVTPPASANPTTQHQLSNYLRETIGPLAFLRAGVSGAIDQARNDPAEWGQGGAAYAKRYGSNFGQVAVGNSVRYGFGAVLHLDTTYHRRGSGNLFGRSLHAVMSSITAVDTSGRTVLSIPSIAAPYAGAWAAVSWQPGPGGPYKVLHEGNRSMGGRAVLNIVREFFRK